MNTIATASSLGNFALVSFMLISFFGVMWLIKLKQSWATRQYFKQHRHKSIILAICFLFSLISVIFIAQRALFGDYPEQNSISFSENPDYQKTLTHPLKIYGLEFPIGTKVSLTEANNLNSVTEAHFKPAFTIANLPIEKINFFLNTDQKIDRILIQGQGVAHIFGWRCDLTQPIDINLNSDQKITQLKTCSLASGNHIDGIHLPTGSTLLSSDGTTYADGKVAHDRWMIDVNTPFQLKNFHLTGGRIYFDATQKFIGLDRGFLTQPIQFGDFTYPQGTQVDKELLPNAQGQSYWWLNHEAEQPIRSKQGTVIQQQDSVIQDDTGEIQYIMRHDPNFNLETHLKKMDDAIGAEQAASSP